MIFDGSLELQVWEAGKAVTGRWLHTARFYDNQWEETFTVHDTENAGWYWRIHMRELHILDGTRDGWAQVKVYVTGADGVPYGMPRPHLIYLRPWIHPSLMVWPDASRGPLVVCVRVPGPMHPLLHPNGE